MTTVRLFRPCSAFLLLAACGVAAQGPVDADADADADLSPRSALDCNAVAVPHVDVAFSGGGAAQTTLISDFVCPPDGNGNLGGGAPVVAKAIRRAVDTRDSDDIIAGVTFVIRSDGPPPVLPRYNPALPRDASYNVSIAAARAAGMAEFQQSRLERQQWLIDRLAETGGKWRNSVALGNLLVADVSVGVVAELIDDGRLAAIGTGSLGGLAAPTIGGPVRSVLSGRQQMRAVHLHDRGYTGEPYRVGVVDGGILDSHDLLAGAMALNEDCTASFAGSCFGADPTDCTSEVDPDEGHGTSVAALVGANDAYGEAFAGVSDAVVDGWKVSEKALSGGGSLRCMIPTSHVALAFENAVLHDEIVNASISTSLTTDAAEVLTLETIANEAHHAGAMVIAGVGNSGSGGGPSTVGAPGSADNVIAVGAVEATNDLADYSGTGPTVDGRIKPDIAAPTDLTTGCASSSGCTRSFDGTSAASPMAAGVAAQLLDIYDKRGGFGVTDAKVTAGRIYATLLAFASPIDGSNAAPDNEQGAGLLQLGDSACSRWRWGTLIAPGTGLSTTTIHLPHGADNVRLAVWWTDLPSSVVDIGHTEVELQLSKGGTTHTSGIAGSSFQRLLIDHLSFGTWEIAVDRTAGPSGRQVHYFWYSDVPQISCAKTI